MKDIKSASPNLFLLLVDRGIPLCQMIFKEKHFTIFVTFWMNKCFKMTLSIKKKVCG